jgi:hypothetical protein
LLRRAALLMNVLGPALVIYSAPATWYRNATSETLAFFVIFCLTAIANLTVALRRA